MRASSPLALSITWEALARMRASECWGESLTIEANLYARAMDNPDFEQGYGELRAARRALGGRGGGGGGEVDAEAEATAPPEWAHRIVEEVPAEEVNAYFEQ